MRCGPKVMCARTQACPRWVKSGKAQIEQMLSALPAIADIGRVFLNVRFVPLPDSRTAQNQLIDDFVGEGLHLERNLKAKRLCGFRLKL